MVTIEIRINNAMTYEVCCFCGNDFRADMWQPVAHFPDDPPETPTGRSNLVCPRCFEGGPEVMKETTKAYADRCEAIAADAARFAREVDAEQIAVSTSCRQRVGKGFVLTITPDADASVGAKCVAKVSVHHETTGVAMGRSVILNDGSDADEDKDVHQFTEEVRDMFGDADVATAVLGYLLAAEHSGMVRTLLSAFATEDEIPL